MTHLPLIPNGTDTNVGQRVARDNYFQLREKLVALHSVTVPDAAAIDKVIQALEKAQLAYKATHGLFGNNPIEDLPPGVAGFVGTEGR
jgi:hypothetical protein